MTGRRTYFMMIVHTVFSLFFSFSSLARFTEQRLQSIESGRRSSAGIPCPGFSPIVLPFFSD